MFDPTEAIKANHLVNYGGVITNINLLYDFEEKCNSNTKSQLIYTLYNDNIEPTIKTVLYKDDIFFVNIIVKSKDEKKNILNTYKYSEYEFIDNENILELNFKGEDNTLNFFKYNKKTGEGN